MKLKTYFFTSFHILSHPFFCFASYNIFNYCKLRLLGNENMAACHLAVTLLCCHHPFQHHPSSSLVFPHHPSTSFIIPIHPQSLIIFHIPSSLLIIHPTTSISLIITNHPPTFTIPHHPSPSINILSPSLNHPS